jgi:hypothetical protein
VQILGTTGRVPYKSIAWLTAGPCCPCIHLAEAVSHPISFPLPNGEKATGVHHRRPGLGFFTGKDAAGRRAAVYGRWVCPLTNGWHKAPMNPTLAAFWRRYKAVSDNGAKTARVPVGGSHSRKQCSTPPSQSSPTFTQSVLQRFQQWRTLSSICLHPMVCDGRFQHPCMSFTRYHMLLARRCTPTCVRCVQQQSQAAARHSS